MNGMDIIVLLGVVVCLTIYKVTELLVHESTRSFESSLNTDLLISVSERIDAIHTNVLHLGGTIDAIEYDLKLNSVDDDLEDGNSDGNSEVSGAAV